ncbi:MAG: DNA translocase FtsK 4TM domain-containing protein, partial [Casimicrobiaceae bacterium]
MFFKPAGNPARRPPLVAAGQLPRFAKLVREAWWLVSAAVVCYLALILATYAKSDPGWSFSGTGEPLANRGGIVGAWLADLLLYLFGVSAWWWVLGALVLLVAGYRRVVRPERKFEHPLALGMFGFALVLAASAALEAIRLWSHALVLPLAPGGALGAAIGHGLVSAIGFNGATLFLLALFAAGSSLLFGISWLRALEHIGGGCEKMIAWVRNKRLHAADRRIGEEAAAERDVAVEQLREDAGERDPLLVVPPVGAVPKSERVVKERQRPLFIDLPDSRLPPLALLEDAPQSVETVANETLDYTSRLIERKLADFGVSVRVLAAYPGPVITRYEIEPAVGVKGAQIVNLVKDLARALSVVSIRVVETIPGKSCMGLELPNPKRQIVKLVEILSSAIYNDTPGALTLALGKDIAGKAVVADLARMPHLLVAGTTGSGKSVAVNAMILSLLYKAEPRQVRLLLIDPKMLELSVYEGIP